MLLWGKLVHERTQKTLTNTSGFLEVHRLEQGSMQLFLPLAWLGGTKGRLTLPHFREARLDKPGTVHAQLRG